MTFISMAEGRVLLLDHFEGQWKVKLIFQAKSPQKRCKTIQVNEVYSTNT